MKKILYAVIAIALLGIGGLFYLGQTSQNGAASGLVEGNLSSCPSTPNCVSSDGNVAGEQKVNPLPVSAWQELPKLITDMDGVLKTQNDTYIAAEFTTSIFRFIDDVEFRLADDGVHVRSASRVGRSDFGVNKARVEMMQDRLGS